MLLSSPSTAERNSTDFSKEPELQKTRSEPIKEEVPPPPQLRRRGRSYYIRIVYGSYYIRLSHSPSRRARRHHDEPARGGKLG